jgi:uncharacterized protein
MNPLDIIKKYCPEGSDAYPILLAHNRLVADKALALADRHPELPIDRQFVEEAAMLHDIGVVACDAPEIGCHGSEPYIRHGILGAEMLRREGLERHARVCERHTGSGITREMIESQGLPLPPQDLTPETLEEKLVCFADKFYSKSHPDREKSVEKMRKGMAKYGDDALRRFDELCEIFL